MEPKGHLIAHQPSVSDHSPRDAPPAPSAAGGRTLGLAGFLIELFLPVVLAAGLLLALAGYARFWDLRTYLGLGVFGFLLVVLSLFISIRVDAFTLARRRERGRTQLLNRAGARSRLVKFVLGGVLIPIAAFAAANLLELPGRKTPMALAVSLRFSRPELSRAEQLGRAVSRAPNPGARVEGIRALQGMRSEEALEQLLHILSDDPATLKDGGSCEALTRALASYGAQAKPRLLQLFAQVAPHERRGAAAPPGDLFERYFSAGFAGLRQEIEDRGPDPATRAEERERLQAAETELRQALRRVEAGAESPSSGSRLPVLILQALRQMDLKEDADLLAFARGTAADGAWSDAVRGRALLLIAKLGGKDDLDGLYSYLENPSPLLEARAMEAIAGLESKLSAAAGGG
ncbi:MAG TPA: hypothetical protein VLI67_02295 [Vicinamibacteria bacterium]|nr:hypothetical protein [Vicinamibacteria bacterium]